MIVDALIHAVGLFVRAIILTIGLLIPDAPDWIYTGFNTAADVWSVLDTLSTWLPISLAVTVAGAIVTAYLVSLTIGLVRMILSYLTLGGGAT